MRLPLLIAGALLLAAVATLAGSGLGQSGYAVTASPAVDTPARDVTYDNATFEIDQLGLVDPGGSVSVTVSAPSGDAYDVYLYDADKDILDRHRDPASATVSFDVPEDDPAYPPGTYVVAVDHDGEFRAITPLVISGYHVSVDASDGAAPGEEVTVEASVTTVDDRKPIEQVQVVIGNDDDRQQATLTSEGGGEYSATFALDSLPEGEHSLYVVVQGSEEVLGREEVLGVSDSHSFTVESGDSSDDGSDGSSSSQSSSEESSSGGQQTAEPTEATTDTSTSTATSGPTETDGSTTTGATDDTASTDPTTAPTTTDDSVITPNAQTTAAPTTESPGQPLGVLPAVAALLVAAALARRRGR